MLAVTYSMSIKQLFSGQPKLHSLSDEAPGPF